MSPSPSPGGFSVVLPLSQAFERTKDVLFRPFDLGRWFTIGFCAWLAILGEGIGVGGGGPGGSGRNATPRSFNEGWDQAASFVSDNLYWMIPVAIAALLFVIALWLLIFWLSSRGRFMFLDNVATNRAEVVRPWNEFSRHGNSLFGFRILLGLTGAVLTLPLVITSLGFVFGMLRREEATIGGVLGAAAALFAALIIGVALALVAKLTKDFVVPVMWLRSPGWRAAWSEVAGLIGRYPGRFLLYLLFHLLLNIGLAIGIVIIVVLTCCIAGCLLALPFLGTVFFLPVLVFLRAYSAYFLTQFGPDFDVFRRP